MYTLRHFWVLFPCNNQKVSLTSKAFAIMGNMDNWHDDMPGITSHARTLVRGGVRISFGATPLTGIIPSHTIGTSAVQKVIFMQGWKWGRPPTAGGYAIWLNAARICLSQMIHFLEHIKRIEKGKPTILFCCSYGACHSERREALCWHVSLNASTSVISNTLNEGPSLSSSSIWSSL